MIIINVIMLFLHHSAIISSPQSGRPTIGNLSKLLSGFFPFYAKTFMDWLLWLVATCFPFRYWKQEGHLNDPPCMSSTQAFRVCGRIWTKGLKKIASILGNWDLMIYVGFWVADTPFNHQTHHKCIELTENFKDVHNSSFAQISTSRLTRF